MTIATRPMSSTVAHISSDVWSNGDVTVTLHTYRCRGCGEYFVSVQRQGGEHKPYNHCPYCRLTLRLAR